MAVPLAATIIGLVGFVGFVQSWTNYFLPFVLLPDSDGFPIQAGPSLVGRPAIPLITVITRFPLAFLFLSIQRYLATGRTAGALCGV